MIFPKMILFDFGNTLTKTVSFDTYRGIEALIKESKRVPEGVTAKIVNETAIRLNYDIGRFNDSRETRMQTEVHQHHLNNYLLEYYGIELDKTPVETERIFAFASAKFVPTINIEKLLTFLKIKNIRTGVISNIGFSGDMLKMWINDLIPEHNFEFFIASSEYVFRKPHRRIFDLALKKANLEAEEVWYCGDKITIDVLGAFNSEIYAIWYKGTTKDKSKRVKDMVEGITKNDFSEIEDWTELIAKLS